MRLFHRENECYVSAEGSFANSGESDTVEDNGILTMHIASYICLAAMPSLFILS